MNTLPLTGTGKVPESIQSWFESARQQAIKTRQPRLVLIHQELSIKAHPEYIPFEFSLVKRVPAALAYGARCERNPIATREAMARLNRPARQEWYEELD